MRVIPKTGVVDYGAGNLYSVLRGLSGAGIKAEIVNSIESLLDCDVLVVPGVGAFGDGMANMKAQNLDSAIQEFSRSGRPLLGICLGTQLFLTKSFEFGEHEGLNLISGSVLPIPPEEGLSIPHVGWSSLIENRPFEATALCDVKNEHSFYFTHSFYCSPDDDDHILAKFEYGQHALAGIISKDNIMGCQFHPELSSFVGIHLLKNFFSQYV